jgi:hypothetical protein
MDDISLYGINVELREAKNKLNYILSKWNEWYPKSIPTVNYEDKDDVFLAMKGLREDLGDLDESIEQIQDITQYVYDLSQLSEKLLGECKLSRMLARNNCSYIKCVNSDMKEALARQKQSAELKWTEENAPKKKRRSR